MRVVLNLLIRRMLSGVTKMNNKYLYTVRWTQPYATDWQRPYLRGLQQQMEQVIENMLEHSKFEDANAVIERVKAL